MRLFSLIDDTTPIISINRWGPNGWKFITACAFAYPDIPNSLEKTRMASFLTSMEHVLPCHRCRAHYSKNVKSLDDTSLASRENLLRWINKVRNKVNVIEGKPEVTFDEMISDCLTGCKYKSRFVITKKTFSQCILFVIFLIISVLLFIS